MTPRIDLGRQPVSTRFEPNPLDEAFHHPLVLAQCMGCGLIQLASPFPLGSLVPSRPMVYREPERHLDVAVEDVCRLMPKAVTGRVFGLTEKDDTTLRRFQARGAAQTWRPTAAELGAGGPFANIETIQSTFTPAIGGNLAAVHGLADVLVARHILEHCTNPLGFLAAARTMLAPGAVLMVEVPDCTKSLTLCDYTMIWEEHVSYFTPATVRTLLETAGYRILELRVHPCPYEDLIVALAVVDEGVTTAVSEAEIRRGEAYAQAFAGWTARLGEWVAARRTEGCVPVLFGAGHLTAAFVNYHGLRDGFEAVIDDTDWKQGCLLPGTGLPVVPSARLADMRGGICLMGVSPDSEEAIRTRNAGFEAANGRFVSILADSPRSMRGP